MRAALLLLPLVAACSSAPSPRPVLDHAAVAALDAADFPGAPAVLAGFDAAATEIDWRKDDAALFALAIHHDGQVDRRLLRLRVQARTGIGTALVGGKQIELRFQRQATITLERSDGTVHEHTLALTPIAVELAQYDAAGNLVRTSTVELYEELLAVGLRAFGIADEERAGSAFLLLTTLQRLGQDDPVLAEQLFAIADRPSVLSVLTHFGVQVVVHATAIEPWRGATPVPGTAVADALPLEVRINGAPSLQADVLVTDARPPFAITGGILGAIARHATDPQRFAVLRLLAARREASTSRPKS